MKYLDDNDYQLIRLTEKNINYWMETKDLPYQKDKIEPYEDKFWEVIKGALFHSVKLRDKIYISCPDPDNNIDIILEHDVDEFSICLSK